MPYYETSRATTLETGVTASSSTSRETKQEYSVPFGSHSVCPHLITAFTMSNVTPATGGDDPNGVYTKNASPYPQSSNQLTQFTKSDTNHAFIMNVLDANGLNDQALNWTYVDDDDFNPFATGSYLDTGVGFSSQQENEFNRFEVERNEWKYPQFAFPWGSDITWSDIVGVFSTATFSNFVGGDI